MKLKDLIQRKEYLSLNGSLDIDILSVTTDISKITESSLFVFLKSERFDVNRIKDEVINKRPIAIVCNSDFEIEYANGVLIRVEDTRALLPFLYYRIYNINEEKIRLCAVTGTNGKTSTAYILQRILMANKCKVGFIGTGKIMINDKSLTPESYSMTTPDPELLYKSLAEMIKEGCAYAVMEVSSHALHFKKTLPLRYAVSIFTNLSPEHMDLHKNMDDYYKTKMLIFEQSDSGIFNLDDEYSKRARESLSIISFGVRINKKADFYASEINDKSSTENGYILNEPSKSYKVNLKLKGRFNIYNSMMAIAAARLLGVSAEISEKAVSEIANIDGRMEYIDDVVSVIIDYAHTEMAFKNVLYSIYSSKNPRQNIITVFGCGGDRDTSKRPAMARIAEKYSDKVIVTADNSRNESLENIINDIVIGFTEKHKHTVIKSREDAIESAILNAKDGDIILLLGKGHERYTIVNNEYIPFDERDIIRRALKKRREIKNDNKT